jgi:hypothetical protein
VSELVTLCRTCANLRGCSLLVAGGSFDSSKIFTEKSPRLCDSWVEISDAAKEGRARAYKIGRDASLRAIHEMKEEEDNMDVVPDFRAMVREGMTVAERSEQLRYETDADGVVLESEDGQKTIRSAFPLRKYASDPDGPVKKPNRTVMFMPPDQLIDVIVKAEVEAGWVIKIPGSKKKKPATPMKALAERKDKEQPMAETKRIQLRKPVGGGATAGGATAAPASNGTGKVASPATGKKRAATAAKPAESNGKASAVPSKASGESNKAAAAPTGDITKALAPILKSLESLNKRIDEVAAGLEAVQAKGIENTTILHDVLMQKINTVYMGLVALAQGKEIEVPESPDDNSLLEDGNNISWYVEGAGDGEAADDTVEEDGDGEAGNE